MSKEKYNISATHTLDPSHVGVGRPTEVQTGVAQSDRIQTVAAQGTRGVEAVGPEASDHPCQVQPFQDGRMLSTKICKLCLVFVQWN